MNTTDKIMTIVGEAFREGFYSVRTYNDTVLNNADEEFRSAATSLAKKVIAEIEALVRDAERWRTFLGTRPANTHDVICEAIDAAMKEKQS